MRTRLLGIYISLIIVFFTFLPSLLLINAPKYYFGNPNFDLKAYIEEGIKQKQEWGYKDYKGDDIIIPPRVLSSQTTTAILFVTIVTFMWGLFWSIYAFRNRGKFKYAYIILLTFASYLLMQAFAALIIVGGATGKG